MASRAARALAALVCVLAGCGGGGEAPEPTPTEKEITVWILESEPDRVRRTETNLTRFTRDSGVRVELVGIGDDELAERMEQARRAGRLPDVVQLPMASAHAYAQDGTLDTAVAQEVVDQLGEQTFSARALSLLTREGTVTAVPSDGWGQLLIYRRDLFNAAGLPAPRSLDDIRRAARRLDRGGLAGITLATAPSGFLSESFEHVALAAGCQLLDDSGRVTLTSPECRRAFAIYLELAREYSVRGPQDVDSTRATYFAGRAAMIFWSPFLLDALAGLRDDAVPDCAECRRDPAFLARRSGLVGALRAPGGAPAQYGTVSAWGVSVGANLDAARHFITYMMSDGYLPWLALSPQGKSPVRFGERSDPERYVRAWSKLESGVDRTAPLMRFYGAAELAVVGEGARDFQRWGFEQGGAALLGAMQGPEPVARALAAAIAGGGSAARAAREAQAGVERLRAG